MKNRWTVARRLKKRRRQNQLKCAWENVKENKTNSWSKAGAEVKVRVVQNSGRGSKGDSSPPSCNTGQQGMGSVHCQLILPHTWHTPESPLSLEGEQGTGAEPAAGGQPSTFWSLCPRQQLHGSAGQLTLRMVNKSPEQFYSPAYSRYSTGEHCCIIPKRDYETVFKYWVQWLKACCRIIVGCMTHFPSIYSSTLNSKNSKYT